MQPYKSWATESSCSTTRGDRRGLGVLPMYVRALKIAGLLPRYASSREALRPKTLLTQTPDLPTVQRLAPPSHVTPGLFASEDASSADVDMLLSSADESGAFLPPDRTRSTTSAHNTGGDAAVCICAAAEEHGADGRPAAAERGALLRRAGGGPGGSSHLRGEVGADLDVMKWDLVRLQDHCEKAIGTKCLAVSSVVVVVVVAIVFLVMVFVIRLT
ncbi:hypothetical protein EDB83DRAFT_412063 [Lactarius deliciosus]|nr:hypothetical protein EDB83DRAFT_412063 [Lactarius deliciosus]